MPEVKGLQPVPIQIVVRGPHVAQTQHKSGPGCGDLREAAFRKQGHYHPSNSSS